MKSPSAAKAKVPLEDVFTYEAEPTSEPDPFGKYLEKLFHLIPSSLIVGSSVLDHCTHIQSTTKAVYKVKTGMADAKEKGEYVQEFQEVKSGVKKETYMKELRRGDHGGYMKMGVNHNIYTCAVRGI